MKNLWVISVLLIALCSCSDDDEVVKISLSADKYEIKADGTEKVSFKVSNAANTDITSDVKIYKDGVAMDGNSFSSELAGAFNFYAEYEGVKSNAEIIHVNPVIKHKKNVLIEDYTGTWCGYCPRVGKAIEKALADGSNIDVVAIHDDPQMKFSKVASLISTFNIDGFPTALIDRNYAWPYPETTSGLNKAKNIGANCGIELETTVADNKAQLKVKVEFAGGFRKESKLVVFVTENGLIYEQANYLPELGANPIKNYQHDYVLRKSLTNVLGDNIQTDFTSVYTKNLQFDLGELKPENITIVAFVVNAKSKETLNSRSVSLGSNAPFQFLN